MTDENVKIKNAAVVLFLGFLALVITYSLFFGPVKKFGDSFLPARTIWVSAEGKAVVSPDVAAVSFSVVSEGTDPKLLADDNNRKISSAIDLVKLKGVEPKDVKTIRYNLSPRYEYDETRKKTFVSGYTLTQTVLVKVRNLEKTAEILGGLPPLGINQIEEVSFNVDDPDKYLKEAREEALRKANAKAEVMVSLSGGRLGKVINVSEYFGGIPRPMALETFGGKGGGAPALPLIEPGSQEITVQVSVQYEIR